MSKEDRCAVCGGSLINDNEERKCLACGRSAVCCSGASVMSAEEARKEVEQAVDDAWTGYLAERRESHSARIGKSSPEDIADYKRRYHLAHREKALVDMLRWNRNNRVHLNEYKRRFRRKGSKI